MALSTNAGEYHNVLRKDVPDTGEGVLVENKTVLWDELVLYEFDGKFKTQIQ